MKRRVLLLCFQNQRTFQQFKSGELKQTLPTSILNLVSGDAAKAVYIRSCQVKTCAIGPDLELHNSNKMFSNAPFFIQPESLS